MNFSPQLIQLLQAQFALDYLVLDLMSSEQAKTEVAPARGRNMGPTSFQVGYSAVKVGLMGTGDKITSRRNW